MNRVIRDIYLIEYGDNYTSIKVFAIHGCSYIHPDNIKAYNFIKEYKIFEVKDG